MKITSNPKDRLIIVSESGQHTIELIHPGSYAVFLENISGELSVELLIEWVEVYIYGVYRGMKNEAYVLHTSQHHRAPHTNSNLLIRSVVDDESSFRYEGLIRIAKEGQSSHGYQKNQNLILSPNAFVESKPNLEILANEVYCTHGSTTGRVNKEQLFYLQTRGMTEGQARSIIVEGFFGDIYEAIERFKNSSGSG